MSDVRPQKVGETGQGVGLGLSLGGTGPTKSRSMMHESDDPKGGIGNGEKFDRERP